MFLISDRETVTKIPAPFIKHARLVELQKLTTNTFHAKLELKNKLLQSDGLPVLREKSYDPAVCLRVIVCVCVCVPKYRVHKFV